MSPKNLSTITGISLLVLTGVRYGVERQPDPDLLVSLQGLILGIWLVCFLVDVVGDVEIFRRRKRK